MLGTTPLAALDPALQLTYFSPLMKTSEALALLYFCTFAFAAPAQASSSLAFYSNKASGLNVTPFAATNLTKPK